MIIGLVLISDYCESVYSYYIAMDGFWPTLIIPDYSEEANPCEK